MAQVSNHCVHTFVLRSKSLTNRVPTLSDPLRNNFRSRLRISLRSESLFAVQALWTSSQDFGSSSDPFGPTFGPTFGPPAKRIPVMGPRFSISSPDFRTPFGPTFGPTFGPPCEANPYEGCKIFDLFERLSDSPSDPPSDPFRSQSLLGVQDFGISDPITRLDL